MIEMNEFIAVTTEDDTLEIDYSSFGPHSEDILFECDGGLFPVIHDIFSDKGPGQVSKATCWDECLDYMISEQMTASPRFGMYVLESVELDYVNDPYTNEGDCSMYAGELRPAKWHELRRVLGFWECIARIPSQIALHWRHFCHIDM